METLFFQHFLFLLNHIPFALAAEAAEGAIGCNDAMARHFGSEGVATEGLADGLGTPTADAASQFAVGDGFSSGHIEEFQIDAALEVGDVGGGEDTLADVVLCFHTDENNDKKREESVNFLPFS